MIQAINVGVLGLVLGIGTIYDVRYKQIPLWLLGGGGLAAFVLAFCAKDFFGVARLCGIVPGIVIAVIGWLSKAIGAGDSALIMLSGYALGIWWLSIFLCFGFFLLMLAASLLLLTKRLGRKSRLPFYPFALASYLVILVVMVV